MKYWYGIGAGAGANLFLRFTEKKRRTGCQGLLLMSPLIFKSGWMEWGFKKVTNAQMTFASEIPEFVLNQMVQTYFSPDTINNNIDLVNVTKKYMAEEINPINFSNFLSSYN